MTQVLQLKITGMILSAGRNLRDADSLWRSLLDGGIRHSAGQQHSVVSIQHFSMRPVDVVDLMDLVD